jgi:hypothetical protein
MWRALMLWWNIAWLPENIGADWESGMLIYAIGAAA